jgi:HEAT repeat protein
MAVIHVMLQQLPLLQMRRDFYVEYLLPPTYSDMETEMKLFTNRICRQLCGQLVILVIAGIIILDAIGIAMADTQQGETTTNLEKISSKEERVREEAVNAILHDRLTTVQKLISMVDPTNAGKYSEETRSAAAFLLGELRAVEAVPVLSKVLDTDIGPKVFLGYTRYDLPVWNALVKIGRPAVPAMIKNLETSDNLRLRNASLDVLCHILGGKRRLLELLAKLESRASSKEVRQRIESCVTFSKEHYKEKEEPLY